MFEGIETGSTVLLRFEGSEQGLAMRAIYDGEVGGVQRLHGFGVMEGVNITATRTRGGWVLGSGRALFAVEAV